MKSKTTPKTIRLKAWASVIPDLLGVILAVRGGIRVEGNGPARHMLGLWHEASAATLPEPPA